MDDQFRLPQQNQLHPAVWTKVLRVLINNAAKTIKQILPIFIM